MKANTRLIRSALLLSAGCLPLHLHADEIPAHPSDAVFRTVDDGILESDSAYSATSGGVFVGRGYYSNHLEHYVIPFQLPDLGPGTFSGISVRFRTTGFADEPNTPIDANLFAIPGARPFSSPLASDVSVAADNHTSRGILIKSAFLNDGITINQNVVTGADEEVALADWFNEAYQDGVQGGNFVFMRLSPAGLSPDDVGPYGDTSGFSFSSGNGGFWGPGPSLTYTFTPADPNLPVIGSFNASPGSIAPGASSTLDWSVTNADTLTLEPGGIDLTGLSDYLVSPSSTTTYTLTATNTSGSRSRSLTLQIAQSVALRGSVSTATVGGSTSSSHRISIAKPAGVQAGDVLIASITKNGNTNTTSAPDGWAGIHSAALNTGTGKQYTQAFYRVADGSEDSSFSFTVGNVGTGGSNGAAGAIAAFSGVDVTAGWGKVAGVWYDSGGPFAGRPGTFGAPVQSTTSTANAITIEGNGAALVMIGGSGGKASTWSGWQSQNYGPLDELANVVRQGCSTGIAWTTNTNGGNSGVASADIPMASYNASLLLALKGVDLGPKIRTFAANPSAAILPGQSATLSWSVSDAAAVTLDDGGGPAAVDPSAGSIVVTPATTTTYTLTASRDTFETTRSVTVEVDVFQPGPYRYYRMVPLAVRAPIANILSYLYLSEFHFTRDGVRVPAASVTSPGASYASNAFTLDDGNATSLWYDFPNSNALPKPVFYDMGADSSNWNVNGCRVGTSDRSPDSDLLSWRIDGSHDNTKWYRVDQQTNYRMPAAREVLTDVIPFAFTPIVAFKATPSDLPLGGSANLEWVVSGADSIAIDNGIGEVEPAGSRTVNPPDGSSTYTLTASNGSYGTKTASVTVIVGAQAVPVELANSSFEDDPNSDPDGSFPASAQNFFSGWSIIAMQNSAYPDSLEVLTGWQDLAPAQGSQALCLLSGVAVAQQTGLKWSDLNAGDQLKLTVAVGDRATHPDANPRWADESFFAITDGLPTLIGSTPSQEGWLGGVVGQSAPVIEPPAGFKSGTMGDVTFTYTVGEDDFDRLGNVGIALASLGYRDGGENGADAPGAQSFWDNVRLDLIRAPGPVIRSFEASALNLNAGMEVVLSWDVENADSVTIEPLGGGFPVSGSTTFVPTSSAVYTLSATNSQATKTREIRVDVAGPVVARYFRFTPNEVRGPYINNYAAGVEISEIEILNGSTALTGATATSTLVKPGNEPAMALDGNFNTSWWDSYLEPLILDFGDGRLATGYRFATNTGATNRDPVSWTLEGSLDGSTWFLLDERTQWQTPSTRTEWVGSFATNYQTTYPEAAGAPVVESFTATPYAIIEGESVTLAWSVTGAESIELVGIGEVQATGTAVVRPRESRNFYLVARNADGLRFESARVGVERLPRGVIPAEYDDAVYETDLVDGSVINGPVGEFFEILDVGRITGLESLSHIVIPFLLPDLGPGGFVEAELEIRVTGGELGEAGKIPVRLHAVPGARDDPWTLDTDVVEPGGTALTSGILIQTGFLNGLTPLDKFASTGETGPAADGLGRWLSQAYADGANAGRYVFLRLSPDALEIPDGAGFGVSSADDANPAFVPTLSYVFNPAGSGPAPVISTFGTNDAFIIEGGTTMLQWSVLDADTVEIDGVTVAAQGSMVISPTETTTYTLNASNATDQRSLSYTQTVLPPGSLRYLRFTSSKVREVPNVNVMGNVAVALNEFQVFDQDGPIDATDAGVQDFGAYGGGSVLVDGSASGATWYAAQIEAGFVIDYRRFILPAGYRIGSYSFVFDPVSWTVEGSLDGSNWTVIDQRTDADAAIPETGEVFSDPFYFFDVPEITSFTSDTAIVRSGDAVALSWSVAGAETVSIDQGVGAVDADGTLSLTPTANTIYTLSATANGVTITRSLRVSVDEGLGLTGYVYDYLPYSLFYDRIQPIANLEQQDVLAGTFIQSEPLDYPYGELYARQPTDLPGLTSPNSFAVVWKGWFDVTIDGYGTYTFGTASDGGSTIYLDLNGDGDFADAGELVVNNNLVDAIESDGKVGSVNLQVDSVRIAIGYWENTGNEKMQARFGKGAAAYKDLQVMNGQTGHFLTSEPVAPFIRATLSENRIAKGQSVTLAWTIDGADEVAIDNGIGAVDASAGSLELTPLETTTYTITATGSGNTKTRSLTVTVTNGGLLARSFDTAQGENLLFPITNLLAQTPTTSFMQSDPVDYPTRESWVETLPGITDWDNFSAVWQGVFNPSIDGVGDYTFGLYSGTGCVIYIDLNGDGDFNDPGENVVERRGFSWGSSTTATVNLDNPNGHRIAIAFTDDDQGGPKTFSARFKKGTAVPYASLDIISGDFAHFVPTLVTPPPPSAEPEITVSGSIDAFSSTYGSASPTSSVSVSAVNLVEGLVVSAPAGFQVSTAAGSGFADEINVGAAGAVSPTSVHVRMDPANPAGAYSGSVTITSSGAVGRTIAVSGTVAPRSLTVVADPVSKIYGEADPALTYSSSGLVGSDALSGGLTRESGEDVGTYAISQGTLAAGSNYSIDSFTGADFTINPKAVTVTLTRNGNSYSATADGVAGFTYSYSGRNDTSYGPSADAPSADGDYTVTATVSDPNYTGSKSEDFSIGADEPHPPFKVTSITMAGAICTMVWESQPDATYIIEATDNPADPQSWAPLGDAVSSQGVTTTLSVDLAQTSHAGSARLFMRVRTQSAD